MCAWVITGAWVVRLTTCASAAGDQDRARTNLRSTARGGRAVAERRPAPPPSRRMHARVRQRPSPDVYCIRTMYVRS